MSAPKPVHPFDACSRLVLASWVLASGSALAQGRPPPASPADPAVIAAFVRADLNGDGQLSRDEVQRLPAAAEQFDRLDTDGNQTLSREEFLKGIQG